MTEEREDKGKVIASFTILKCKTDVIEMPNGKRHFESDCLDKKARDYFSSCFEEEAVLRVNPKVILEDIPPVEPPAPVGKNPPMSQQPEPPATMADLEELKES